MNRQGICSSLFRRPRALSRLTRLRQPNGAHGAPALARHLQAPRPMRHSAGDTRRDAPATLGRFSGVAASYARRQCPPPRPTACNRCDAVAVASRLSPVHAASFPPIVEFISSLLFTLATNSTHDIPRKYALPMLPLACACVLRVS